MNVFSFPFFTKNICISIGAILIFSLTSCVKWNLDFIDIVTFEINFERDDIGYNFKNDLIQQTSNAYISVGSSSEGDLLINFYSEAGKFIRKVDNIRQGAGHSIVALDENKFFIVGTDGNKSFLVGMDSLGKSTIDRNFFNDINNQLGLLDSLILYDMAVSQDKALIMTGFIKQTIGNRRMIVIKANENGDIIWFRVYIDDTFGTGIKLWGESDFVVSGFKNNNSLLVALKEDGTMRWNKNFPNTCQQAFNDVEILGDSVAYLINTGLEGQIEFINLIAIRKNSTLKFDKKYSEFGSRGYVISKNKQGELIIGATSPVAGEKKIRLIKMNAEGGVSMNQVFEAGTGTTLPSSVLVANDTGFALFGISGDNEIAEGYRFLKTDAAGQVK